MFGLENFKGSCWVNTCLQALFRIPELQYRYSNKQFDDTNLIDECLCRIWNSKGEEGLKEFFECVKTQTMPAGNGIGDSHELLNFLCDKLPFLDKLCRFKIADSITCNSCLHKELKEDSVVEYSVNCYEGKISLTDCIVKSVMPVKIEDWTCDKCNKKGCEKQQLIGSFPKVMIFHKVDPAGTFEYSSILVMNNATYALISVSCYGNFHWWSYGRDMPPGSSWYTLNDKQVLEHTAKQFPISPNMRLLIYYRLEN